MGFIRRNLLWTNLGVNNIMQLPAPARYAGSPSDWNRMATHTDSSWANNCFDQEIWDNFDGTNIQGRKLSEK
jgi:hypothetical protein